MKISLSALLFMGWILACGSSGYILEETINDDTLFYGRLLTTVSSKKIFLNITTTSQGDWRKIYPNHFVGFLIHSNVTALGMDLKEGCVHKWFSQVNNLNTRAAIYPHSFSTILRELSSPTTYYLSLGKVCNGNSPNVNLKGASFRINITELSEVFQCVKSPMQCSDFDDHKNMALPNLLGQSNAKGIQDFFTPLQNTVTQQLNPWCLKNIMETFCFLYAPKCDLATREIVDLCMEMCIDLISGCQQELKKVLVSGIKHAGPAVNETLKVVENATGDALTELLMSYLTNCYYLPSRFGNISCFYKEVTCGQAPELLNGVFLSTRETNLTFSAGTFVQYACNEDFKMEGNQSVVCQLNGRWSSPPTCVEKKKESLILKIVLPLVSLILIAATVVFVTLRLKSKTVNAFRNRVFDACVFYAEEDISFTLNTVLPALEQNHDPPFRLCIHDRDFKLGKRIEENILFARQNSNSAIIIMSQNFIKSGWCRMEFADGLLENRDTAFRVFVIMMQPEEDLQNVPEGIAKFLADKTYGMKEDPELFRKIAEYLEWVKRPKKGLGCQGGSCCKRGMDNDHNYVERQDGFANVAYLEKEV